MHRTSHEWTNRNAPRWRLWTAQAMRSPLLAGRFFSAKSVDAKQAGETIVESFDEPSEDAFREDDLNGPAASMDPPAAPKSEAYKPRSIRRSDRSSRKRVVLFLPGPVTEADLLAENMRRAASIKQRQLRRRRTRWLRDNVGTVVFVIGLLVLTWFVAAS
jgi:hypothetical protein